MMNLLNEQKNQRNSLEFKDAILSFIISAFFILIIMVSGAYHDIEKTPEAKRYEYDIHAKFGSPEKQEPLRYKGTLIDNGTVGGGELSTLCGENWYTNFYKHVNRPHRLALLDTCQLSQEQKMQLQQAIVTKSAHLQKQISTKYNYFLSLESKRKVKDNIIGFSEERVEKDYFRESLSLNNKGRSETLARVPTLLQEIKESRELLALVAAMEGDTAFPYSEVYQGDISVKATQLNELASLIRKVVRINTEWADKAEKTRNIISMGVGVFMFMLAVAYVCLLIVRRQRQPLVSSGITLVLWGILGFILTASGLIGITQSILWSLLGIGIALVLTFLFVPSFSPEFKQWCRQNTVAFQMPATSWGFSFFVLCLWISIVILLELSVKGHVESRFLIYNHYDALYWALFSLTVAPTVANALSIIFSTQFAKWMIAVFWASNTLEKVFKLLFYILFVLVFAGVLSMFFGASQSISNNNLIEGFKLFAILGLALILTVKRFSLQSIWSKRWILILIIILATAFLGMISVGEMGTVLVLSYSLIIILSVFFLENKKTGYVSSSAIKTTILTLLLISVLTFLLLVVAPAFPEVVFDRLRERKMSMINPFGSTNDQMAIIHWLRQSAPNVMGYSLGDIPWCGYNLGCAVPKQMQSDYTATSIIILSGWFSFIFFISYMSWLMSLVKGHLEVESNRYYNYRNLGQVFLLWSGIIWVIITLAQMIVTVLGNLGLLPLTGVTFPFVSYGKTSLILCSVFVGLLINRPSYGHFR